MAIVSGRENRKVEGRSQRQRLQSDRRRPAFATASAWQARLPLPAFALSYVVAGSESLMHRKRLMMQWMESVNCEAEHRRRPPSRPRSIRRME